ncbi:exodeoxyribonuclease V subunit alpha [Nocardioides sp. HM23]|uniref:exodeoxyribonuclease V subunit alpha n=1 Tax=Nocardioides bizhenqiangii TaxID=3095076 RepID=UPI002ACA87B2|nr:exodeoxyribonuclease V subunit alpha [Nocardioides sp. HM23]MDZ5619675.1 exodeoxyribonuclease V subunit alpha [Nocardioides sp. HM23]
MTELFEVEERDDHRIAAGATGLLATFNQGGLLTAADVHAAARICALAGEDDPQVALAVAVTVRAARHGSVCVDLADLAASEGAEDLPWPDRDDWQTAVTASPLSSAGVLRREGALLYLDRFWREEGQVRDDLLRRIAAPPPVVEEAALATTAGRLFPEGYDEQRTVALAAARQWTTVLTGGPGTGKTTTVAGLLALLTGQADRPLRVALTAPTGKASARLQQAVEEAQAEDRFTDADRDRLTGLTASTLHRLLGWMPGSRNRFRHHRRNKLPHDVVVVDETSMVSLTMMARLLEAVRPDARLVLVGDADQLASVEAGAVLADLVQGLAHRAPGAVTGLRTTHRFGESIGALAESLRQGDSDRVLALLTEGEERVSLHDPVEHAETLRARLLEHALAVRAAAVAGDADGALAAMDAHRLLCAHRDGPYGVAHWNRLTERLLSDHDQGVWQEWYAGRPILVTANDYGLGLFNGDTGVVVREGDRLRGVIAGVGSDLRLATARLGAVETLHAMTIHKSQGSQVGEVTLLLPPEDSPLLTRELFYTAVTRAKQRVHVVGTQEAVVAAVERRAQRATGLIQRLAQD